jgi:hypothetical protein
MEVERVVIIDSTKLGYEKRDGKIYVMYPKKNPIEGGPQIYEGGFPVEFPEEYFRNSPNEITFERADIYLQLMGAR